MSEQPVLRVNYFDRQYLRTQDFVDEQAYHIATRRRHNLSHHRWGIAQGLTLMPDKDGDGFVVLPGYATDGYGREIVVPDVFALPLRQLKAVDADMLDVYVRYQLTKSAAPPAGYAACDADQNRAFYRAKEGYVIWVQPSDSDERDPRLPKGVNPESDYEFPPYRTADEAWLWPVFLGQIERKSAGSGTDVAYQLNPLARRPYVGLVATRIESPSRGPTERSYVQLEADNDTPRFVVALAQSPSEGKTVKPIEVLTVDAAGKTDVHGNMTVQGAGGLTLDRGAIFFYEPEPKPQDDADQTNATDTPEGHLYRRKDYLCIDLGKRDDAKDGVDELAIGWWSDEDSQFVSALTVARDNTVTISGTLRVGNFEELKPDPSLAILTEEAKQQVALAGISGRSAAATLYSGLVDQARALAAANVSAAAAPSKAPDAVEAAAAPPAVGKTLEQEAAEAAHNLVAANRVYAAALCAAIPKALRAADVAAAAPPAKPVQPTQPPQRKGKKK